MRWDVRAFSEAWCSIGAGLRRERSCRHRWPERLVRSSAITSSGDRYAKANNLDAAIIEYRNAVQRDPKFAEAYQELAKTYISRGDGPNVLRNSIIAADLLPDSIDAQIQASNLLLIAGKFDDAKARAEKAVAKAPQNARAKVLLASAMAGLKDVDTAVKELEEAIRLDPKQAAAYASLAVLKAGPGDHAAAERTFQQAIAADPTSVS